MFKPKELGDGPLTLLSTLASTYADEDVAGDLMLYDYAPRQREYENDGLKRVPALGRSMILLEPWRTAGEILDRSDLEGACAAS